MNRAWNIAAQQTRSVFFRTGLGQGYGCHQRLGIWMFWVLTQIRVLGQFNDFPQVHNRDPVGDMLDDPDVVGDKQVAEAEFIFKLIKQVQDLGLDADIQG